jgi:serine phosphatase RsbU (regulator of sigma subunit)
LYIFSDGVYEIEHTGKTKWNLEELIKFLANHSTKSENEIDALYALLMKMNKNKKLDDDFSMLKISFV